MSKKKNKRRVFSEPLPKWLWGIMVIVIIFLCCLPVLFTQHGKIDFTKTGQIGDTIGGTMGPFVAIIAALLTFLAFWVQYEANLQQRKDIAIERHEAKFYKMLDIYSEMTKEIEVRGAKGKKVFAELVGELTYTFFTVDALFSNYMCSRDYLNSASKDLRRLIIDLRTDPKKCNMYLTILSYNLFFYGKNYIPASEIAGEKELVEAIRKPVEAVRGDLNKIEDSPFIGFLKSRDLRRPRREDGLIKNLFMGHSEFLGHYFRHLFQVVKYVSSLDDDLFGEEAKDKYVKMLRAQMSDYEQILLFYNALTEQGAAWNRKRGDMFPKDWGYISRFRLIKNLPKNYPFFGVDPKDVYEEDILKWKENGKDFFESRFLLTLHSKD